MIISVLPINITDDISMSDICHNGFSPNSVLVTGLSSSSVWLTNSVNIADHLRLTAQQSGQSRVENGRLLLCKVFTGRAIETTSCEL